MIKNKKVIALLPMKGHSERVPRKNLKLFNAVPLYRVILSTLLSSKYIDEVIINTDCNFITEDVKNHFPSKVSIRERPVEIRGDMVSMNKIIEDDLNNTDGAIYLQTHSTNPLLKIDSLDGAIEEMIHIEGEYDSIFSVTKIQTRFYDKDGEAINHNPSELVRTQDLPPLYEENSCLYIFTKKSFKEARGKRIGNHPKMYEIDKVEAIDIDNMEDFIIAEAIHKTIN